LKQENCDMSESQLRVKLLVAAGIVGASLLGASFVGCSSGPPSPSSAPFASYNGSPMAPGGGMPGGPVAAPGVDGYSQQNRQAFMAETQRMGGQQNLTAQDVVAMSRSGMPDTQIAMAIQQRGAALRATPNADKYLAANGVNPAVLGGSNPASPYPVYPAQQQMAAAAMAQQPGYPPAGMQFAQAGPGPGAPAINAGMQQPAVGAGGDPGVQSAAYQMSGAAPGSDASAAAGGQSWRPMAH
jgi:hypothetical protein